MTNSKSAPKLTEAQREIFKDALRRARSQIARAEKIGDERDLESAIGNLEIARCQIRAGRAALKEGGK